jgi:aminoglycoside phosphotransferase (APT) family kinase protein
MARGLSSDAAVTIFGKVYPAAGTVIATEFVPRAYNFEVWRVSTVRGHYALKVAHAEIDPARIANAFEAQRLVTAANIRSPRMLVYDAGVLTGRQVCVQEWLTGDDAQTAWPHMTKHERTRFALEFGREVARVHAISGPCFSDDVTLSRRLSSWRIGLRDYLGKYATGMGQANLLAAAELDAVVHRIEGGIATLSPHIQPALTHWDLWLANTLVDAGSFVGLIDLESAAFSDPLVDFVRLEVWVFDPYPESQEPFLTGYYEAKPVDLDTEARLEVYRGLEYFAEMYRTKQRGEVRRTASFQERLSRWMRTEA